MRKFFLLAVTMCVACMTLTACQQHRTFGEKVRDTIDPPKGPVEQAGRSIDRAMGK